MLVDLGPGHIVLDGDPAPLLRWGPSFSSPLGVQPSMFGPCLLWPNGWMDHDATWYKRSPRSRQHCVRCGPHPKGAQPSPQFSAHACCGQTAGWIKMLLGREIDLSPGHIVFDGDPLERGTTPLFSAHVCCGQTVAHLSYCWALVTVRFIKELHM